MLRKLLLSTALVAMPLTLPVSAAMAEGVTFVANAPVIELSVTETVKSVPDMATISTGVVGKGATAQEALRQASIRTDSMLKTLKTFNIADKDIQTAQFSVGQDYDYSGAKPRLLGYQTSSTLSVTVRDLGQLGKILDALTGAGATDINGPTFAMADDTPQRSEARRLGLDKLMVQARDYARWAGYDDVRIIWVTEDIQAGGGYQPPMPMMAKAEMASDASMPIAPGEVGTMVMVRAKFEMVKK